jgi:hypothetical protein
MDRNHTLIAGADIAHPVSASEVAKLAEIRELATSPAADVIFQEILDRAILLSDRVGADSVVRLYSSINAAFDLVADSAGMRRAHQALDGHIFTIGDTTTLAASRSSRSVVPAAGAGVSVIYVNGVGNSPADALATLAHIRQVLQTNGMPLDRNLRVSLFYNATWTHRPNEVGKCLVAAASIAYSASWLKWANLALKCTTLADFGRAKDQMLDVLGYAPDLANVDAVNLASRIQREVKAGRAVIVLGHSQGTLIAQQALKLVTEGQSDARTAPAACLGAMNLAAPLSYIGGPVARRDGLAVQGTVSKDIILWLGFNEEEHAPSYLSNYYDAFRTSIITPEFTLNPIKIIGNITLEGAYPVVVAFSDYQLHRIDGDYLGTDDGRQWVTSRMSSEIATVSTTCANSAPSLLSIISGNGQTGAPNAALPVPLKVRLTNHNGAGVKGAVVTFAVVAGGGQVAPPTVLTDTAGYASAVLTLGSSDQSIVQATVSGSTVSAVQFTETTSPAPPTIGVSDTIVTFSAVSGGTAPADKNVQVTNVGGGTLSNLALSPISYDSASTNWLTATLAGSSTPTNITFTVSAGQLQQGSYGATVQLRSTNPGVANSPRTVRVRLAVLPVGTPGALRLNVTALSDSFYAKVSVSGPNGFTRESIVARNAPQLINGLLSGTYSLTWSNAVCFYQGGCGWISYGPVVREQAAVVTGGKTTDASTTYEPKTGYMLLSTTGLNDSVTVRVDITGPGGYTNTLYLANREAKRLPDLVPGTYTFFWYESTCAYQGGCSQTYHPSSRNQQAVLVASQEPLSVSMAYSQ